MAKADKSRAKKRDNSNLIIDHEGDPKKSAINETTINPKNDSVADQNEDIHLKNKKDTEAFIEASKSFMKNEQPKTKNKFQQTQSNLNHNEQIPHNTKAKCHKGEYFFSALVGGITAIALAYSVIVLKIFPLHSIFPHPTSTIPYEQDVKQLEKQLKILKYRVQDKVDLLTFNATEKNFSQRLNEISRKVAEFNNKNSKLWSDQPSKIDHPNSIFPLQNKAIDLENGALNNLQDLEQRLTALENAYKDDKRHFALIPEIAQQSHQNKKIIDTLSNSTGQALTKAQAFFEQSSALFAAQELENASRFGTKFQNFYDILQQTKNAFPANQNLNFALLQPYLETGFQDKAKMLVTFLKLSTEIEQAQNNHQDQFFFTKIWQQIKNLIHIYRLDDIDDTHPKTILAQLKVALMHDDYQGFLQKIQTLPQSSQKILMPIYKELEAKYMTKIIKETLFDQFYRIHFASKIKPEAPQQTIQNQNAQSQTNKTNVTETIKQIPPIKTIPSIEKTAQQETVDTKNSNPTSIKSETLEKQTVPLSKKPLQRFQENSLYQQVKPPRESISSKTANPAQP